MKHVRNAKVVAAEAVAAVMVVAVGAADEVVVAGAAAMAEAVVADVIAATEADTAATANNHRQVQQLATVSYGHDISCPAIFLGNTSPLGEP
jgi:hypothetical protein